MQSFWSFKGGQFFPGRYFERPCNAESNILDEDRYRLLNPQLDVDPSWRAFTTHAVGLIEDVNF